MYVLRCFGADFLRDADDLAAYVVVYIAFAETDCAIYVASFCGTAHDFHASFDRAWIVSFLHAHFADSYGQWHVFGDARRTLADFLREMKRSVARHFAID